MHAQSSINCKSGYLSANLTLRHVQSSVLSECLPFGKPNVRIGSIAICRPNEVLRRLVVVDKLKVLNRWSSRWTISHWHAYLSVNRSSRLAIGELMVWFAVCYLIALKVEDILLVFGELTVWVPVGKLKV